MLNRREILLAASAMPFASSGRCFASDSASKDELHWLPLYEVRERIAKRETTSVQLTELMLDRIKSLEKLHAYLHVDEAGAIAAAQKADEASKKRQSFGPLHGVPIAVKDLLHAKEMQQMRVVRYVHLRLHAAS